MIIDENVEQVRKAGDELVKKHGGLDGLFKYLQQLDRQHAKKVKNAKAKSRKNRSNGRKGSR